MSYHIIWYEYQTITYNTTSNMYYLYHFSEMMRFKKLQQLLQSPIIKDQFSLRVMDMDLSHSSFGFNRNKHRNQQYISMELSNICPIDSMSRQTPMVFQFGRFDGLWFYAKSIKDYRRCFLNNRLVYRPGDRGRMTFKTWMDHLSSF